MTLISGTNRPGSMTRKVTSYVESLFRAALSSNDQLTVLDLLELPTDLFQPKHYAGTPATFEPFKKTMVETDSMFFVVPEYNGGAPGALKYFIDMLPFPATLQHRPTGFLGVAAGRFGNLRGVEQIEAILKYRNAFLFPERVFIPAIDKALDETGQFKDEMTAKLVKSSVENFVQFASQVRAA